MTGSLQVKRGIYNIVLSYKDSDGKHKTKWISTKLKEKGNKRKAEQMLRDTLREYEERHVDITKSVLFTAFMLEWLGVIQSQVKANTYHQYELIVKNSVIPFFTANSNVSLQDLTPTHIQRYYKKKLDGGASPNTVKRHHANIHKALKYAVNLNLIPYNPADRVELPKQKSFTGKFYTDAQIKTLFSLFAGSIIETPVLLAATYGLRRSEVIGLKWDSVDFQSKTLTIRHTVVGNGKNLICSDSTKTKKSHRTLPLLPHIEKHLKKVKARQDRFAKTLGKGYTRSDYVCTWDDGRLIRPEYVSRKFKEILQESTLPVIRFHDLRHSAASLLVGSGYSLKEIGEWLGHASVNATNIYAHLQYQSKVDMGNRIAETLFADA